MTTIAKKKIKKNKKYHTKSKNRKIVERGKINIPDTQTHDRPRSWLGTIKSSKVKLLYGSKPPPLKTEIFKLTLVFQVGICLNFNCKMYKSII